MKKLLIFMLVLGMASVASAQLQISVGGDPDPVDSEIWLMPSEIIELDIWNAIDIAGMESYDWALVVDSGYGAISGGVAVDLGASFLNVVEGAAPNPPDVLPDPPLAGIYGLMANFGPTIPAGTVIVDLIEFHCVAEGDAVIQLYAITSGTPFPSGGGVLMDSVVIHQLPEPMTLALLGFGGCALSMQSMTTEPGG